jgi:mannitol-specific phosphotransferase system IIBC component
MNRARVGVQRFGTFLSGMIMPNIAAFIAWGFITMLFIPRLLRREQPVRMALGPSPRSSAAAATPPTSVAAR